MKSEYSEYIDHVVKVLGAIGVIGSIIWSVLQYKDTVDNQIAERKENLSQEIAQMKSEAKKPFLERQLDLYLEAARVTSQIAISHNDVKRDAAIQRFWELYWGELAVVEDQSVAQAMVNFKNALVGQEGNQSAAKLSSLAISISHACRDSIQKSWAVDLGKAEVK